MVFPVCADTLDVMSPQGPTRQSPAVYRRRRLVLGAFAVVLVLLLWWLISSIIGWVSEEDDEPGPAAATSEATAEPGPEAGSEDDATSPSPEPGEQEDEEDTESDAEEDLPEGACAPGNVAVTASTGEDSYAPDEAPLLIMEIEHTGGEDCALDVGTAQQEFSVVREGREVFTTAQCGSDDDGSDENYELEMEPGQVERAQLNWPRSDSSVDCGEPAELTPGEYELVVTLGGIASEPHQFTLQEQ